MDAYDARRISELLRALADAVERSPAALAEFLEDFNSRFKQGNADNVRGGKVARSISNSPRAAEIVLALQRSKTRDEATSRLRKFDLNRTELTELARSRSVHITKSDSIQKLEEKLVEAFAGSRLNSEAIRGTSSDQDQRFVEINSRIDQKTLDRLLRELISTRYNFIFNPESKLSKTLTFKKDGTIGEGRNNNENSWRIHDGRLEILNSRGEVYSRFVILSDGRLQHTNDTDTRSIKGQYLEPITKLL